MITELGHYALVLALVLAMLLARLAVVPVLRCRRARGAAGEQRGEGGGGKDTVADLAVHGDSGCDARTGAFAWCPLHVKTA